MKMAISISSLHAAYVRETGMALRLRGVCDSREFAWHQFIKAGFTEQDLVIVARYLKAEIKAGNRNIGALKFHNMIEDVSRFEEDLAIAKTTERNRKPPPHPRDVVLSNFRRTENQTTTSTAKPIGDLINDLRKAVGMNERNTK